MGSYHPEKDILWKSFAPENILRKLGNTQLADAVRTWYIYRDKAVFNTWDIKFSDLGAVQYLWFNSRLKSKSKQYFFYSDEWFDKGICNTIDLLNIDGPQPIVLTFDQLIEKFGISRKDRRFYNFLIKNIPCEWLEYLNIQMTMFLIFLCE